MTTLTGTKSRCVLLVDDDPFIIAVYVAKLKRAGLEVDAVTDGADALHRLESVRPDLVILDLNMPKLNGIEVLKFIRGSPALETLPVLVLTNVCSESIMRETWEARPTRYLIKRETPPNVVVEEVLSLLSTAPHPVAIPAPALTPEPDATRLDPLAAAHLREMRAARSPEAARDALVRFRQAIQPQLGVCRQHPPGSFPVLFDEALDSLLEDLYAHPGDATPSMLRALELCYDRLRSMFSEKGTITGGAFDVALVLVAAEDDYLRESLGRILHRPFVRPVRVGDIGVALHLMRENTFKAVALDAPSEEEYVERFRALPGGAACPLIAITPLAQYRPSQKPGFERVAKPVNPADLAVKLLLLL